MAELRLPPRRTGRKPTKEESEEILRAAYYGNTAALQRVSSGGVDITAARDVFGDSPLHRAAMGGNASIVNMLLGAGMPVDIKNNDGNTPLHIASGNGHENTVQLLVKSGATVDAMDNYGNTPLHDVSREGLENTVQLLVKSGATVDAINNSGNTPLHIASVKGHKNTVQLLVNSDATVDAMDNAGRTPLTWVVMEGHANTAHYLITEAKADRSKVPQRYQEKLNDLLPENSTDLSHDPQQGSSHNHPVSNYETTYYKAEIDHSPANSASVQEQLDGEKTSKALEVALNARCQELENKCMELESKHQDLDTKNQELESKNQDLDTKNQELETKYQLLLRKTTQLEDAVSVIPTLLERLDTLEAAMFAVERLWVISRNDILLSSRILGTGGWGVVQEATYKGRRVAAKTIHEEIVSDHNQSLFLKEIQMMAKCHHKNLVEFIGAVPEEPAIIVIELMHSTLRSALKKGTISLPQVQPACVNIAEGLRYLHNIRPKPIIHRDVSAANVLLKAIEEGGWIAKLSDFGSAQFAHLAQTPGPGAAVYAAPEVTGPPHQQTVKIDVYSYGVLLVEVLTKSIPTGSIAAHLRSLEAKWPQYVAISRKCVNTNPNQRPAMTDILTDLKKIM